MLQEDVNNYKDAVRKLCVYTAQAQNLTEILKGGGSVNSDFLKYTLCGIKVSRNYVLSYLNCMGVATKEISFMEDNEYFGFSIKQGRILLASPRNVVLDTVCKWLDGFPDTANWYQYGAAFYALALAFPDSVDLSRYYPAELLKKGADAETDSDVEEAA